jgi:putative addiction module component (TIGR02574 family)
MTPKGILDEILRLPADEQLELVEEVWDHLAASPSNVPVPEWHRAELDRRLADPSEHAAATWDEVRSRLKDR